MGVIKTDDEMERMIEDLRSAHWARPTKKEVVRTAISSSHEDIVEEEE